MFYQTILNNLNTLGDKIAYKTENNSITYAQMRGKCAAVCALLQHNTNREPVVVYGHKQPYMKCAVLACIFCGIPYIPIDVSFPPERVENIIRDAKPFLILGDYESESCPNIPASELEKSDSDSPISLAQRDAEDICYMIFTSGSTGAPKGVRVTYANVNSCVSWLEQISGKNYDCILNQAKFSFDLTVADFYLSAVTGATHYALTDEAIKNFSLLFKALSHSEANLAVMTPSFAQLLLTDKSFSRELMPRLQTIIFCGETLKCSTAAALLQRFEGLRIINCYGPTEATFAVTSIEITPQMCEFPALPVGRAKPGVEIRIEEDGEIVIIGESVAKGYLPPADNSAFCKVGTRRAYHTGDYGYLQDGILYFGGRRDNQIKLSGFRIELEEIENALLSMSDVANARVLAKRGKNGEVQAIRAFVVPEKSSDKSATDIKGELANKLPAYMLPRIKLMPALPLNANEKCDDKQLMGD